MSYLLVLGQCKPYLGYTVDEGGLDVRLWARLINPRADERRIVVTALGKDDLCIGGAMVDDEPHADRSRHKEQDGSPLCHCD